MHAKQRPDFVQVIQALAATYGKEPTEAMLTGYWMGLSDVDLAGVKRAAATAMRQGKFMPTVAELRELSGEMPAATRAALAWKAVKDAVVRHGYYATVKFDDPIITAVIRNMAGSWDLFDDRLEADGETWLRKDFERLYVAFWASGVSPQMAAALLGNHERENIRKGAAIAPPVLVVTGLPPVPERLRIAAPTQKSEVRLLESIGKLPE